MNGDLEKACKEAEGKNKQVKWVGNACMAGNLKITKDNIEGSGYSGILVHIISPIKKIENIYGAIRITLEDGRQLDVDSGLKKGEVGNRLELDY